MTASNTPSQTSSKRAEVIAKRYRTRYLTFVLENLYQPHNIASVMRTCDNFGLQDLHIIADRNRFHFHPETSKGAQDRLSLSIYQPATHGPNPYVHCISDLKEAGYRIAATTLQPGSIDIDQVPLDHKLAMCFGTEEQGLSQELHDLADMFVTIPMFGFTQSFNISVSAALCASRLTRRLWESDLDWRLENAPGEKPL